jgi:hypothetical protein
MCLLRSISAQLPSETVYTDTDNSLSVYKLHGVGMAACWLFIAPICVLVRSRALHMAPVDCNCKFATKITPFSNSCRLPGMADPSKSGFPTIADRWKSSHTSRVRIDIACADSQGLMISARDCIASGSATLLTGFYRYRFPRSVPLAVVALLSTGTLRTLHAKSGLTAACIGLAQWVAAQIEMHVCLELLIRWRFQAMLRERTRCIDIARQRLNLTAGAYVDTCSASSRSSCGSTTPTILATTSSSRSTATLESRQWCTLQLRMQRARFAF